MIHMLIGIQGSGKTTFSKILKEKLHCDIVSSDGIRKSHPEFKEDMVWPEIYRLIGEDVKMDRDVIYDATNITPKVRKRFMDNINLVTNNHPFKIMAYFIDTPLEECIERVKIRNENKNEIYLPIEVISSYYHSLIKPTIDEGFVKINIVKNNEIVE